MWIGWRCSELGRIELNQIGSIYFRSSKFKSYRFQIVELLATLLAHIWAVLLDLQLTSNGPTNFYFYRNYGFTATNLDS